MNVQGMQRSNIVIRNGRVQSLERWIQRAHDHYLRALLVKREIDGSFTCTTAGPLAASSRTSPIGLALKRAGVELGFASKIALLFEKHDANEEDVQDMFPEYLVQAELAISEYVP